MPAITEPRRTGDAAEAAACTYLQARGLVLLARNCVYRVGELDAVMRDGETLVFVEVRYRKPSSFGDGLLSITRSKRQRLVRAALCWLSNNPSLATVPCRFDVISVHGPSEQLQLHWQAHAFTLDDA